MVRRPALDLVLAASGSVCRRPRAVLSHGDLTPTSGLGAPESDGVDPVGGWRSNRVLCDPRNGRRAVHDFVDFVFVTILQFIYNGPE